MYACRLKTEVELMTKLNHSNIIKMYDVFEDERFLYIVMELCTGGELFDRIIQKTESGVSYSERDAARLMMQILDALEYCHANNIIHRDLKPENFLFRNKTEEADLVIIDFGLSKALDLDANETFMTTRVGTPYYLAPEVRRFSSLPCLKTIHPNHMRALASLNRYSNVTTPRQLISGPRASSCISCFAAPPPSTAIKTQIFSA